MKTSCLFFVVYLIAGSCSSTIGKQYPCEIIYKRFDIDSSVVLPLLPKWTVAKKPFASGTEDLYYRMLESADGSGYVLFQRRKFHFPITSMIELDSSIKTDINSSSLFNLVSLIRFDSTIISSKASHFALYKIIFKKVPSYLLRIYFLNSDSSRTDIEMVNAQIDTVKAIQEMHCIIDKMAALNR